MNAKARDATVRAFQEEDVPADLAHSGVGTITNTATGAQQQGFDLTQPLPAGFTLTSVLQKVDRTSEIIVAELVPEVVEWNRGPMGAASGNPLADSRTIVRVEDEVDVIAAVDYARETGTPLSVRSGGHGFGIRQATGSATQWPQLLGIWLGAENILATK